MRVYSPGHSSQRKEKVRRNVWPAAHGPELQPLEFRIGPVDVQSDARANHHADHRVGHRVAKAHGNPHHREFAAAPHHGGMAVLADGLHAEHLGASIAPAHSRRQRRIHAFAPGAHLLRRRACDRPPASPPDRRGPPVCRRGSTRFRRQTRRSSSSSCDDQQRGSAAAAQTVDLDRRTLARRQVHQRQGLVDAQHGGRRQVERIVQDPATAPSPEASTDPEAGLSTPAARRSNLPLPEPWSPMTPIITPSGAAASNS